MSVSAQLLDSFCRIDVADTGPGVPEGDQAAVFNRFYRGGATRAAEGLGLGLYLAREILARQGGYIRLSSRPRGRAASSPCTFQGSFNSFHSVRFEKGPGKIALL